MTDHIQIDDTAPVISYTVGAARSSFPVPFAFFEESDLVVTSGDTVLVLNTQYTVTGEGESTGGTVTFDTAVTDTVVVIERILPIERVTDFPNSGPLDIPALNTQFDKNIAIDQQLDAHISEVEESVTDAVALFTTLINSDTTVTLFTTRNAIAAANVGAAVPNIRTAGYAAAGDGGAALYVPAVSLEPGGVQSLDGAFWRLADSEIVDGLNVMKLGAKLDGVTDDTAVLLAAMTLAGIGGKVTIPAGTMLVTAVPSTSTFTLPDGLSIEGAGKFATRIKIASGVISPSGQALFFMTLTGQTISGLTIDGNGHNTDLQAAIFAFGALRPRIRDLRVINIAATLGSIFVQNSTYGEISNIDIEAFAGSIAAQTARCHGLFITQVVKEPTFHRLSDITIAGGAFGISIHRQQFVALSNFVVWDLPGAGAFSGDGINFNNSNECAISNGVIYGRRDAGLVVYTTDITQIPEGNTFSNISTHGNTLDGVYVAAGRYNVFTGITAISNNQLADVLQPRYGVYVNVDSGTVTDSNIFTGLIAADAQTTKTQVYGVSVAAGATNTSFLNASLTGNLTGNVNDAGTNTIVFETAGGPRLKTNHGYLVPKTGDFSGTDTGGTVRPILAVSDSAGTDYTAVISAGGGVAFLDLSGAPIFKVSNGATTSLSFAGSLTALSLGNLDSGGAGFRLVRVAN